MTEKNSQPSVNILTKWLKLINLDRLKALIKVHKSKCYQITVFIKKGKCYIFCKIFITVSILSGK